MKIKIRRMKCLIPFCILLICFGCQETSNTNQDLIEKAIFSKEFKDNFRICEKDENEILVFNDLKENSKFVFSKKNDCGKTINFSKINFEYDVNSRQSNHKGIVLFRFDKDKDSYKLSFLDLETNFSLKLVYDKNQDLVDTSVGSF